MTEDEHDSSSKESGTDRKDRTRAFLRRPAGRVGIVGVAVLAVVAIVALGIHSHRFESTDDAFVDARIVRLSSQIAAASSACTSPTTSWCASASRPAALISAS